MAKQLNVNMNFTADTSNVESNLNKLKQSLNQISSTPINLTKASTDLQQAVKSAQSLQMHLNNAFNVKTGNIDLSKLQMSLAKSGENISGLSISLLNAGKTGQEAFLQMQTAIQNSNVQIRQSTGLLTQLNTTLKNTVKWQISSSLIHGFMGAIQSAKGYAEDLNKSLTNIRIVTQASTDDMAKFAEQANKSAKSLSSTTTAYTNAALIYYQQGLDDKAVKERTDATIKMSNVTGQSAQEVSSYMTAIWNNFDDGSKSLEHYADVITALGASTASSSKEIAEGLEKFAAIGNTVGLSYDYATTALATVVAQTRQSADVVGTAFKTLFARIQDLELGETLDDGTTLGKYSQALEAVGINIKDSQGNLKDMNAILDEMGVKWGTLSKDQQVALAQNVAGVRQYTQLVALMDNWDKFQQNLGVAENSEGALQEQVDVYAESWEGAQKRVRASLQGVYNDLIPTDELIKGTNATADMLNVIDDLVEGFGGIQSIILLVTNLLVTKMSPAIANTTNQMIQSTGLWFKNIKNTSGLFNKMGAMTIGSQSLYAAETQSEAVEAREQAYNTTNDVAFKERLEDMNKIDAIQKEIILSSNRLTNSEKEKLALLQKETSALSEQKMEAKEKLNITQRELEQLKDQNILDFYTNKGGFENRNAEGAISKGIGLKYSKTLTSNGQEEEAQNLLKTFGSTFDQLQPKYNEVTKSVQLWAETEENILTVRDAVVSTTEKIIRSSTEINDLQIQNLEWNKNTKDIIRSKLQDLAKEIGLEKESVQTIIRQATSQENLSEALKIVNNYLVKNQGKLTEIGKGVGIIPKDLEEIREKVLETVQAEQKHGTAQQRVNENIKQTNNLLGESLQRTVSFGGVLSTTVQGFSSLAMGAQMIKNAIDTFKDEDSSVLEKFSSLAFALPMVIGPAVSWIGKLNEGYKALEAVARKEAAADLKEIATKKAKNALIEEEIFLEDARSTISSINVQLARVKASTETKENAIKAISQVLQKKGIEQDEAELIAKQLLITAEENETGAINKNNLAQAIGIVRGERENTSIKERIGLLIAEKTARLGVAAAVLAGVAALVAIGYAVYKYYHAEEDALEAAKKATKEAKESAQEAQQTYDSLMSTIADYKEAKNGLSALTEGTTEWAQEVTKLNGQVLELMDTYEGIAKYVSNQDGVLTISDAGLDYLADTQLKRTQAAQNKYAAAAIKQNQAEDNLTIKRLSNELSKGKGRISEKETRELIKAIQGGSEITKDVYDKYGITVENANEKVLEASNALLANTAATEALTDQMANNDLAGQDWYDDSDFKGYWQNAYSDYMDNTNIGAETYVDKYFDKKTRRYDTLSAFKEYAEDIGLQYKNARMSRTTPNVVYYDENNEKQVASVQDISDTLYRKYAKENFKTSDEYDKANTELTNIITEVGNTFGNLSKETQNRIVEDTAKAKSGKTDEIDFSQYLANELNEITKKGSPEELKKAANNYINGLTTDLSDKIKDNLEIKKVVKPGDPTAKNFADRLNKTLTKEDGKEYYDTVEKTKTQYADTFIEDVKSVGKELGLDRTEAITLAVGIKNPAGLFETDGAEIKTDTSKLKAALEQQQEISLKAEVENVAAGDTEIEKAGLKVDEVADYANYLREAASAEETAGKKAKDLAPELNKNAKSAEEVAKSVMRMNKGIETLSSNINTWKSILKKSSKSSQEYAEAINGIKESLADVLGIEKDYISTDFVEKHLKDIEKAAKGDAKAIDELGIAAAKDIAINVALENTGDKNIQSQVEELVNNLDIPDIKVGATIDASTNADFMSKMQGIVDAAQMTEEQANAFFESIGFTPEYEMGTETVTQQNPIIETTTTNWTDGYDEIAIESGGDAWAMDGSAKIKVPRMKSRQSSKTVGYTNEEQVIPTVAMNSNGGAKIKNLTRTAKGSMNNNSSSNSGGKSSGKSGGGGGGGGNKYSGKKADKVDSGKERYHAITKAIDANTKSLDKLNKAKDRAFGANHIKAINAEISGLKEQIKLQREIEKEAKGYEKTDKKKLKNAVKNVTSNAKYDSKKKKVKYEKTKNTTSVKFNADGSISNYNEIYKNADKQLEAERKAYNKVIDKYNGKKLNDKQKKEVKAAEKEWEAAQKQYENLDKYLKQYEEDLEKAKEAEIAMYDYLLQIRDKKLEKIDYKVDLKINIKDRDLKVLERQLQRLEKGNISGYMGANFINNATGQMGKNNKKINAYKSSIQDRLKVAGLTDDQIEKVMSGNGSMTERLSKFNIDSVIIEGIMKDSEAMYDLLGENEDLKTTILSYFEQNFEQYKDDVSKIIDGIEHAENVAKNYKDILELAGKATHESVQTINKSLQSMSKSKAQSYKKDYEYGLQQQTYYQDLYKKAYKNGDMESAATYKKMLDDWKQYTNEAQENMLSSLSETLQLENEMLEENLEQARKTFEESIVGDGYDSIDALKLSYELEDKESELYLPGYEKMYRLSKLTRDVEKSIDNTDNIKAKQKLLNLQGKINDALEEGVELTQYDLDRLQTEYDLELARIALEDAQNAKTQVRMQRDANGNWSYTYVADDNKIEQAQQKYEDSLYNMRKLDEQHLKELRDGLVEVYSYVGDKTNEIWEKYRSGEIDESTRDKLLQELSEYAEEAYTTKYNEMQRVVDNEKKLLENESQFYAEQTGNNLEAWGDWHTKFEDTMVAQNTGILSAEEGIQKSMASVNQLIKDSGSAYAEYYDNCDTILKEFNITVDKVTNSVEVMAKALEDSANEVAKLQKNLNDLNNYNTNGVETSNSELSNSSEVEEIFNGVTTTVEDLLNSSSVNEKNGKLDKGDAIMMNTTTTYDRDSNGKYTKSSKKTVLGQNYIILSDNPENSQTYILIEGMDKTRYYVKKEDINTESYDTGGYTGEWGNDGRFALLHQKELILNAGETENFLNAIKILRDIELPKFNFNLSSMFNKFRYNKNKEEIQQNVTITAEFPNATNHNEIEQAFNNIINSASQYVNRKDL